MTRFVAPIVAAAIAGACGGDSGGPTHSEQSAPGTSSTDPFDGDVSDAGPIPDDGPVAGEDGRVTAPDEGPRAGEDTGDLCATPPLLAGCPCASAEECDGACFSWLGDEKKCVEFCLEECPEGHQCVLVPLGADPAFVCLPEGSKLCQPCKEHSECQTLGDQGLSACVDYGGEGSFCGIPCKPGGCPSGYVCADAALSDGTPTKQCRKTDSQCECSETATTLGLSTTCLSANGFGTCEGARVCTVSGLTDCDAPTPAAETCDGLDNNCNGIIDDTVPGVPPSDEVCDGLDNNCDGDIDEGFPDSDGDGLADCADPDDDGDEVIDEEDVCPEIADPDQADQDGDGEGDACDDDIDGDGFHNEVDCVPTDPEAYPDGLEVCDGLDNDCDGQIDEDTCDDENPCTVDACDAETLECVSDATAATGQACDADGDGCTSDDTCLAGVCSPGPPATCEDPSGGCLAMTCTSTGPVTFECGGVPLPKATACQDGNICTIDDLCDGEGACVPGPKAVGACCSDADCDDENDCTADTCDVGTLECTHASVPDGEACDADASGCTVDDACQAGQCVPGEAAECPAAPTPCLLMVCVPSGAETFGCSPQPGEAGVICDDGNPCTAGDLCGDAGNCIPGPIEVPDCCAADEDCDDTNPCTGDVCTLASGACQNIPLADGDGCDADGDGCTVGDTCLGSVCLAGDPPACPDDADPCTKPACVSNGAESFTCGLAPAAPETPCDDVDPCTVVDQCGADGVCAGVTVPECCTKNADCDDANPCTTDLCDGTKATCVFAPGAAGTGCSDGSGCTTGDTCAGGVCLPGTPVACPGGGDGCLSTICVSTSEDTHACETLPDQTKCNDGNPCTVQVCQASGECLVTSTLDCDDKNPCTTGSCDGAGGCTQAFNNAPCDDGVACTQSDTCLLGSCSGVGYQCFDGNVCTNDVCTGNGGCSYPPNSASCNDFNQCTKSDKCSGGSCSGTSYSCDDGNNCTNDICNGSGGCSHPGNSNPCNDGNPCSFPDNCSGGSCKGSKYNCDDKNVCTTDSCLGNGGCANYPINCDDGKPTTVDSCDPKDGCQHCTAGSTQCVEGIAASCIGGGGGWTGGKCCVANVAFCVDGIAASCQDDAEHWTGKLCCVECATQCVAGIAASCQDDAEHWTGKLCCVENVSQCVPGIAASCQGPGEHWTGKLCCVD